ncbi:C2 family cysteine protease [Brachybacterium hainanense]|uniref:C2 family cysteine protease n=1 Tax=Brachybacterium hainanense TaxID=1541174 RepID=A0ABV6R8Y1_9MICO
MTARHGVAPTGRTPWRRRVRDLLLSAERVLLRRSAPAVPEDPAGREAAARPAPGPHMHGWRPDATPLDLSRRPRQGRLGDCWVMASLLGVHAQAPQLLESALVDAGEGRWHVRLAAAVITVDREMPVDARGRWVYATQSGQGPGWAGLFEKAFAAHLAGSYRLVARGFGRSGLAALTGVRVRTLVLLPSPRRIRDLLAEGRAVLASTHPLSPLVTVPGGRLPANHVMAVVGADPVTGTITLRNPWRPDEVLVLPRSVLRRGFISLDVTAPLG